MDIKKIKSEEFMRLLQIVDYKDGSILIRKFPKHMYVWDVFYNKKFYSSYIIIKPVKGKKELDPKELAEVVKMCYAGAAATIDLQRGDKMPKTDKAMIKTFEKGRKTMEAN